MLPMPTDSAGRTRLLPASLPLRHFGAAALFQLVGWLLIAWDPAATASFTGGMGPALAALHAFTLGTLTMTALGAGLQLLPVATVQSVRAVWLAKLVWWPLCASLAALVLGLARVDTALAALGAAGTMVTLAVHAGLLAANLAGARRARAMTAFAWVALAGLVAVIASGPALVLHYRFGWFADARGVALGHLIAACYGYLGLLTVGFSYLLVPMFMVRRAPAEAAQRRVLAAASLAIAGAVALALTGMPRGWMALPGLIGLGAALVHSKQMIEVSLRRRTRDGPWSLWLMRFAWGLLPGSVALGLVLALSGAAGGWAIAWVVLTVLGWLASFVLAVAMRILPFLATVHVKLRGGRLPLVSALTPAPAARVVALAHPLAVLLLVAGVLAGAPGLVTAAGWVGAIGACAFVLFIAGVVRRVLAAAAGNAAVGKPTVEEPAAEQPAAEEPAAAKPTAEKP